MSTGLVAAGKAGPLAGLKVIEMAGLGPVPLAGLLLSEMGAQVLRIERAGTGQLPSLPHEYNIDRHGRALLRLDLKRREGTDLLLRLAEKADMLLEGFRPDVMERLGLGPEAVLARNPALIYGRMTGFGQDGPLAGRAGQTSPTSPIAACCMQLATPTTARSRRSTLSPTMAVAP
jgi:alpha-methylacyl-CoA racemase